MLNLKKILRGLPKPIEEVVVPEHPLPQHIKDFMEAFHGKKINNFIVYDVNVEPEKPYGDLKSIDVAEQTLTLKPGKLWAGIDPTKTNHLLQITNICIWYDGTMRPGRGHNGNCTWAFDGQIWKHL